MLYKSLAVFALGLLFALPAFAAQDQFVKVEVRGTLHNDFDHNRTTITANGYVYDVDFGGSREMARTAEKFGGSEVALKGFLHVDDKGKGCPIFWINAHSMEQLAASDVRYERPVEERERVIIKEEKPLFKAGPLEIK